MPAPTHDADPPPPRRSRVEDEVLEILARADRPPTASEKARARMDEARFAARRTLTDRSRARALAASPIAFIGGSLLLAIVAVAMRPFSPLLGVLLGLASAGLLLAVWLDRRPRPQGGPRWRGRDLGDGPRLPDFERFRERWRNPPDR